jgi:hypothetical protein
MPHKSIVLVAAFAAMAAAVPAPLAPQRLSECPKNQNYNGRECVCDRGFERSREGGCVEPPITVRCGRNEVPDSRGGCKCDRGFDRTREGCVKPDTTCPTSWSSSSCGWTSTWACPPGTLNHPGQPGPSGYADNDGTISFKCCCETAMCGRNEVPNSRGGCDCDRGFDRTRKGCVKASDDDDDDDDAPPENMRGDLWCEKKKSKNARICAKENKRGAFRYRDEWCVKMCATE